MTNLLLYDMLKAQLLAGAVLLKISVFCEDNGYYCITLPISKLECGLMYLCHPSLSDKFINMCSEEGIPVIPFEQWTKAKREAIELGRYLEV